tara:strand:+ start:2916 stop:5423 length:2508 start_codon:yes stop_codon:yes gene_type:complete
MKKIILILLLFAGFANAQDFSVKVNVVKYLVFTSAERDTYTVPTGQVWKGYNTTTGQFEKNIEGTGWVLDGGSSSFSTILGSARDNADLDAELDLKADVSSLSGYLPLIGGTMSGAINMGNANINNAQYIAVNNNVDAASFNGGALTITSNSSLSGPTRFVPTDTEPSSLEGRTYWDDSENRLKAYDGINWKAFLLNGDVAGTDNQTAAEVTYDNATSGLTATTVQDGIDELSAAAGVLSINVRPTTGGADFVDTTYTTGSPFAVAVVDGTVNLPNNGALVNIDKTPDVLTNGFYDTSTQKIQGYDGSFFNITIEFSVRPTSPAADIRIKTSIDIGGAVGEIYPRNFSLSKGDGVEHYYSASFLYYTKSTWETNGGSVKISTENGPIEIYDIRYVFAIQHYDGDIVDAMTLDEYGAILNATGATAANPFATIADLGVADGSITNAKLSNADANSLIGNNTGSAATPDYLTTTEVRAMLNVGDGANVSKVGTPVDNQIGVWTGDGTIEGTPFAQIVGDTLKLSGEGGSGSSTILQLLNPDDGSGNPGGKLMLKSNGWGEWSMWYDSRKAFYAAGGKISIDTYSSGFQIKNSSASANIFEVDNSGNVSIPGTVDGRDIAADGTIIDDAVLNSDTSTASMSFVVDEDDMSSDSATKVPTQQSVKAYVDANSGSGIPSDVTGLTGAVEITNIVAGTLSNIAGWSADAGRLAIPTDAKDYKYIQVPLSDLSTTITTGTKKGMWIAPADGTIESPANNGVAIWLDVPGTSTGINIDINKNGADIATTNLTTDATEESSDTAATDFVLSSYTFSRGDKFMFDIDAIPTGATGAQLILKVYYD